MRILCMFLPLALAATTLAQQSSLATPKPQAMNISESASVSKDALSLIGSGPIEIKVVVISMFEPGADTGDTPGEYQYWVEREHLDTILPFPQGYHDLRVNRAGVLGVLTGVGTARAAATIMALGTDPRFDLTHAYFLIAGIAGSIRKWAHSARRCGRTMSSMVTLP